jgi:hypothetical protein
MSNSEQQRMVITIDTDGETIHKETFGFKGCSCADRTAFVERILGSKDIKRSFKEEYFFLEDITARKLTA